MIIHLVYSFHLGSDKSKKNIAIIMGNMMAESMILKLFVGVLLLLMMCRSYTEMSLTRQRKKCEKHFDLAKDLYKRGIIKEDTFEELKDIL